MLRFTGENKSPTMTTKEALELLKVHNEWRRGAEIPMPHPTEIGVAIDKAIEVMEGKVNNCAFQYYSEYEIVDDKTNLTIEEAKDLWKGYYGDMVEKTEQGKSIEVAIWINMRHESDYRETLVHLSSPEVKNGKLCEVIYYDLF
jgi:hypothetical protein